MQIILLNNKKEISNMIHIKKKKLEAIIIPIDQLKLLIIHQNIKNNNQKELKVIKLDVLPLTGIYMIGLLLNSRMNTKYFQMQLKNRSIEN